MAVATEPITTTRTLQSLIQAEGLESAAQCTSWIPGRWPGPATHEVQIVQWSGACDICYCTLLHIVLYYYMDHCCILLPYLFLHHFLLESAAEQIMYFYKFIIAYYYNIITTLLQHYYNIFTTFIIITLLLLYNYPLLHLLLLYINTGSLLRTIMSLLRHYYVIITSLLQMGNHVMFIGINKANVSDDSIITCYAKSQPPLFCHYYALLRHHYTGAYFFPLLRI